MLDTAMAAPASSAPASSARADEDYDAWCRCVRRLLGWSEGARADWPALYASGHTPRDAAGLAAGG